MTDTTIPEDERRCECSSRCDDGLLWDAEPGFETEIIGHCDCKRCHS